MPKYRYLLLDGTEMSSDLELAVGSYIWKASDDYIGRNNFIPTDEAITSSVVARGVNQNGPVTITTSFGSMPIIPTEGLICYRPTSYSGDWIVNTTACQVNPAQIPSYTSSVVAIFNPSSGKETKRFVHDINIKNILLEPTITESTYDGVTYYTCYGMNTYYYAQTGAGPIPKNPFLQATNEANNIRVGFLGYNTREDYKGYLIHINGLTTIEYVNTNYNQKPYFGTPFDLQHEWNSHADSIYTNQCFPLFTDTTKIPDDYHWTFTFDKGVVRYDYNVIDRNGEFAVKLNEDAIKLQIANLGFAFRFKDVIYKPIVEGGVVTGYTSDIDAESEWDSWRGIGDHTFPDKPGGGGGGGEDHDNGDWALDYLSNVSVGGTVRYYLMTSEELLALNEAFDSARIGFNPLQSIISVMQVAVPQQTLGLAVRAVSSIYFRGWTITEGQDSGWNAPVATHLLSTQRMNVSIGSIEVPKLTGTFLDYEPYGSVEAYIPFCGWMKLPSKLVVGHTVTFSMSYDIRTCSCIVTAWCNGANIGQITGSIGTEIPMSTNGASIKKAALIQSSVDMISGTAMSTSGAVLGALSGSTPLMTAGMINTGASLIGGITQMALTNSQNFSMSIGNTGDNSRFYGGSRVVVRCVSGSFMIPDGFGDSTGYLVMKRMNLSSLKGFTVVDDPKIDVACTDVERDMLREMLVSGIVIR